MAFSWFKKSGKKKPDDTGAPDRLDIEKPLTVPESPPEPMAPEMETRHEESDPAMEAQTPAPQGTVAEPPTSGGFFSRLKNGLSKTRAFLTTDIEDLFSGGRPFDDDLLEELEELLITADIGIRTSMDLIEHISAKASKITDAAQLKDELKSEILRMLQENASETDTLPDKPHVIMVVGVNGVGKTTTIGKLAAKFSNSGKKVLIAAADTFRAAAIEQLAIWAERAGADIVKHQDGSDPAAVAYDAVSAALARGTDVVLVDTAGRLHTKVNLMAELEKIKRAVSKVLPDAPQETLLVLDATTGQNALSQANIFNDALNVTGIALTKLDGTAKGGVVISICHSLNIPLKYIGVGEQTDDLQVFDPSRFVDALL